MTNTSFDINSSDCDIEISQEAERFQNVSKTDEDLLSILVDLPRDEPVSTESSIGNSEIRSEGFSTKASMTDEGRLAGVFCSKTVFNLSQRSLTEAEIQVLEKGLDFAPVQRSINEPELKKDFEDFSRRMRIKWNFRNEVSENFSETPVFRPKSKWKPPPGHPGLKLFLSQLEKEIFDNLFTNSYQPSLNMTSEEWQALRGLADDRSIVIKQADKGSCVVVWGREDYIKEAQKQLKDTSVYRDIEFKETILSDLAEKSNKFFKSLCSRNCITDKECRYFSYDFKKATNLGKLYLLPKIHKRLQNVPGRPVISNCGTPTEKASEFLNFHLKPLMQNSWSYIRDSSDFIEKMKRIGEIPKDAILVTADVVGLYPSIPHKEGLEALREKLDQENISRILSGDLVKLADLF